MPNGYVSLRKAAKEIGANYYRLYYLTSHNLIRSVKACRVGSKTEHWYVDLEHAKAVLAGDPSTYKITKEIVPSNN